MIKKPAISIIMSVYNGEEIIRKAIESVLLQSYKNFELIIIDDKSSDKTVSILKSYQQKDQRIKLIRNYKEEGVNENKYELTKCLNIGLKKAKGKYIARIDADDWWIRDKLKKQVNFLNNNQEIGIVGTNFVLLNKKTGEEKKVSLPETNERVRKVLYKQTPFAHSTVLIRSALFQKYGLYDESFIYAQDYELWNRFLLKTKGYNLQEFLCFRTGYNESVAHKRWKRQQYFIIKAMLKYYKLNKCGAAKYLHLIKRIFTLLLPSSVKDIKLYLSGLLTKKRSDNFL